MRSSSSLSTIMLAYLLLGGAALSHAGEGREAPAPMSAAMLLEAAYNAQVDRRLFPPEDEARKYAALLERALFQAKVSLGRPQFVLAVDRSPYVQAVFLFWMPANERLGLRLIGASPVSTGWVGQFDHFETPLGVFEHSRANPDFRAEGTRNAQGIRGYGMKGMRVFDLGWQRAQRGWGTGGPGDMRLQMHATDPLLEQWLGSVRSKGCIRIPATLNRLLDRYAVLDADYEYAIAMGARLWVIPRNQRTTADSGRYIVVVDSNRTERPIWSPAPHAAASVAKLPK